jgi:hypothetical protein
VVIEKCLGHKMPKIMATYNRNEMLVQRREALINWSDCLESLLQDNIVSIQAKKTNESTCDTMSRLENYS